MTRSLTKLLAGVTMLMIVVKSSPSPQQPDSRKISFNCFYSARAARVRCLLARLDIFLRTLTLPSIVRHLICTSSDLNDAPAFRDRILHAAGDQLEELDLGKNNLQNIPGDFLTRNPNLTRLNLRNNKLRSLPDGLLSHTNKLVELDLSKNRLVALSPDTFRGNPRLRTLQLWYNQLRTLPDAIFQNNRDLETLSISFNLLEFLPAEVLADVPQLKTFFAFKNNIKCLSATTFQANQMLQDLHLGYNDLTHLPDELFINNSELSSVKFWANRLECMPRSLFDRQHNLTHVSMLMRNEGLPQKLRQGFRATQPYNTIRDFSQILKRDGNVTCGGTGTPCEWDPETSTLDCSHREVSTSGELRGVCERVRRLRLNNNRLDDSTEVQRILQRFPETRTLELQGNRLNGTPSENMLRDARFLQSVDLSMNDIDYFPEHFFDHNIFLKKIYVKRNRLHELPANLLRNNAQLVTFDARDNSLEGVPEQLFSENGLLDTVLFDSNRIKQVKSSTFEHNPKLKVLQMTGNGLEGSVRFTFTDDMFELEKLEFSGNRIEEVRLEAGATTAAEDERRLAKRVRVIDIGENLLARLPNQLLSRAPNTEHLRLARNRIVSIEPLAHLPRLRSFDITDNRLTSVPATLFGANFALERVALDENSLAELPDDLLANNTLLRSFSASGNRLRAIPRDLFAACPLLDEVRFSDNRIAALHPRVFAANVELRYVALGGNAMRTVPRELFALSTHLRQVYLNGNELQPLAAGTFDATLRDEGGPRRWDDAPTTLTPDVGEQPKQRSGNVSIRVPPVPSNRPATSRPHRSSLRRIDLRNNPALSAADQDGYFRGWREIGSLIAKLAEN